MTILGIDPGTRNCGYALVSIEGQKIRLVEAGLIKMKSEALQYQIPQVCEAIEQLFRSHTIDEVAMEDIFYAHNPKTVLKLAQFRGAITLKLLQEYGMFSEYTPLQVKKALTGKAKAAKEQVAFMVKQILGITKEIKPLDITDAMAVAIAHAQRVKLDLNQKSQKVRKATNTPGESLG
ncbi:MAG: crossover junction endodeoxyribonuclease RuvC [Sulfuricurvum sp.]|uniref:crossover junction endodeoxyribonuclease RuvC n=1 Tax=Sulfuricurvum sp. TaxID=2025608 RepID=UPI0026219C89|nr:crossover junction endodeoxyribonuclease RuvC [Sulfuricurvum sp.]MDD2838539.1 crossover junction endodeoxyribonuclease RuvC [Sulfuricurvum sp.]MDD3596437.1 crossover junction endodeoxyribonuclease RuvC [Sulfuricurvum sp.]MDD4884544.1 crossover junction endodeoxyribonuclease RuvC [Sulfuricurvum sp.]